MQWIYSKGVSLYNYPNTIVMSYAANVNTLVNFPKGFIRTAVFRYQIIDKHVQQLLVWELWHLMIHWVSVRS